jgi:hypothetical protein
MIRGVAKPTHPGMTPRDQLVELRSPLLELHRALLDAERREYEAAHGRVPAAELLQLALRHEQFAWLHQVSTVIVRVDELIASEEPPGVIEVSVVSSHLRALLRPLPDGSAFEQRYDRAVQNDPAVLLAHRRVMQALPPEAPAAPETVH